MHAPHPKTLDQPDLIADRGDAYPERSIPPLPHNTGTILFDAIVVRCQARGAISVTS
jgi:hypothetical protein